MRKLAREAVICMLVGMLFVPAALLTSATRARPQRLWISDYASQGLMLMFCHGDAPTDS